MTKSNNDWLDEILDKNLEDIVDANFNGYNYALNKTAKAAITSKINEIVDTIIGEDDGLLPNNMSGFVDEANYNEDMRKRNRLRAEQRKRKDEALGLTSKGDSND